MYRLSITGLALTTMLITTVADCQTAEAQGLFRRLRNRIQSRFQVPSQQYPAPQSPSPLNPSNQAQGGYVPPAIGSAAPQRVQPIAPAPGGATQPTAQLGSGATSASQFGGSILSRPAGRARLGIKVEADEELNGLRVTSIDPDSRADDAGLRTGDVIVAVNGQATPTASDVARHLDGLRAGDSVRASIVRGQTTSAIMIPILDGSVASAKPAVEPSSTVAQQEPETSPRPEPLRVPSTPAPSQETASPQRAAQSESVGAVAGTQATPALGIEVDESPGVRGVTVSSVAKNTPAAAAGIQLGDRIVSLDGQLLADRESFGRELAKRKWGDQFRLQLVRDGALVAADVEFTQPSALASDATTPDDTAAGGSLLEGFGSALGGLFGGKSAADAKSQRDEMALEDDEGVQQVDFESAAPAKPSPSELKPKQDPPSLKKLEPPTTDAKPLNAEPTAKPEKTETAESLREQIRRLEQRLKELED